VDKNYYISTLRQQLLANGCELRDKRDDADFVVEARAGAIGTDRNDLLFGIPSMNVPQIPLVQPVPAAIPEIPIAKRKDQRGIAKIAVFAYHRATGTPVWQSGIVCQESSANDVWIFGAGPFQRGTIYQGTEFAGGPAPDESPDKSPLSKRNTAVALSKENLFTSPANFPKQPAPAATSSVAVAAGSTPTKPTPQPTASATPAPTNLASGQPPAPSGPSGASVPNATVATSLKDAPATAMSPAASSTVNSAATSALTNPALSAAYAKASDLTPLPQPRFNSPQ
jgi:hypothetical protein